MWYIRPSWSWDCRWAAGGIPDEKKRQMSVKIKHKRGQKDEGEGAV